MNAQELFDLGCSQVLQVTSLAAIVWLVQPKLARFRPQLSHALWALVILKCVTPPLIASPISPFSRWPAPSDASGQVLQPAFSSSGATVLLNTRLSSSAAEPLQVSSSPRPASGVEQPTWGASAARVLVHPASWLTVWLTVSLILVSVTIVRIAVFYRRIQESRLPCDSAIDQLLSELMHKLRLPNWFRRRVRVQLVAGDFGPAVIGLWRPTVLLPRSLAVASNTTQLKSLLAHELVHIRRGDLWWAWLQTVATSLWWFHPLVWLASRRLTRACELSCDEETVRGLQCNPTDYARTLVNVLERKRRLHVAPAMPGVRPTEVTSSRLERIMRLRHGSRASTNRGVNLLLMVSGTVLLPGAAWGVGQDPIQAQDAQSSSAVPKQVYSNPLAAQPTEPSTEKVHPVADYQMEQFPVRQILARMIAEGLAEAEQAPTKLIGLLPQPELNERSALKQLGLCAECLAEDGQSLKVGDTEAVVKIYDSTLYMLGSSKYREAMRQALRHLREFGFQQVVCEIKLIRVPSEVWQAADFDWGTEQAAAATQTAVHAANSASEPLPAIRPAAGTTVDQATATASVQPASLMLAPPVSGLPLLQRTEQTEGVLRRLLMLEDAEVLSAPSIAVPNGGIAEAKILNQHPTLVGMVPAKPSEPADNPTKAQEARNTPTSQPIVNVTSTGVEIRVQPTLISEGRGVKVNCEVSLSELAESEVNANSGSDGNELPNPQLPQVRTMKFETQVTVPKGMTFVLNGWNDHGPSTDAVFAFVTCSVLAPGDTRDSAPHPVIQLPHKAVPASKGSAAPGSPLPAMTPAR